MGRPRIYDVELLVFGRERMGNADTALPLSEVREICARYVPDVPVVRGRRKGYGASFIYPTDETHGRRRYFPHGELRFGQYPGLPVVLHEIAHALAFPARAHCSAWLVEYVRLVEIEMGPRWAARLRSALANYGRSVRGAQAACREETR